MDHQMRLSVADNFDDILLERLSSYPVDEIYGKLSEDAVGGGRLSITLQNISRKKFARHVTQAGKMRLAYNYLLNSACLGNMEITRRGQKKIRALLDWICSMGIGRVTVANALLLKTIKRCYPQLHVRISVFAGVDNVQKARMWQDMGADCITLDSIQVNREFETLKAIREALEIDLQLLVNNSCNSFCAMSQGHMTFLAHGSQSHHPTRGFAPDYCFLYCSRMKLEAPVNYIRSDWIRPEDLNRYIRLGYRNFKLTERGAPTAVMEMRVKAYSNRSYDGNLLDLVQPFAYPALEKNGKRWIISPFQLIRKGFRPWLANPFKFGELGRLASVRNMLTVRKKEPGVVVDNQKLDGFIKRFEEQSCRNVDCGQCGYCHEWADKAVKIDAAYSGECLDLYNRAVRLFESGSLWRYFK